MWDLIVSVPDHCLSFYLKYTLPYMLISIKIKNSHAAYNDHSNNIGNEPTI